MSETAVPKHMANPVDFTSQVETIYSLPDIFYKISEAVDNPDNTMEQIADVISNDQSVAMRVLHLANSAFFSFPSKVETITHALTLIGIHQVRDLIQATAIIEAFEGLEDAGINMRKFWEHSICCGIAAKDLALLRHESHVERFFVLGLLHDIGRLVFFQHGAEIVAEMLEKAKNENRCLYDVEQETLGYTHADITSSLMQRWHFPPRLFNGIKYHHGYSSQNPFPLENATVHIADVVVHTLQVGNSGERFIPPPQPEAWSMLGLDRDVLPILVKEIDRQLHDVLRIILP
jgi:HD-like signal output (HDOD) protein